MSESLVAAAARSGLAGAFGHCSARVGAGDFVVSPPMPLGCVGPGHPVPTVPIDGPLPAGVSGEVRIHQAVYRLRPDVAGICRVHPPVTVALSTQCVVPLARHGHGSYFNRPIPLWEHPSLVRDERSADALAATLGESPAIILRGNGAVTVGEDLRMAAVLAWFLEDAARVELVVRQIGGSGALSADEAGARATWDGGILERMWDYLTFSDPEEMPTRDNHLSPLEEL